MGSSRGTMSVGVYTGTCGSARGALPLRRWRKRRHRGKRCRWVRLWRTSRGVRRMGYGTRCTWLVVRCFHILYIASNGQCTSRKSQIFAKYFVKIISIGHSAKGRVWWVFILFENYIVKLDIAGGGVNPLCGHRAARFHQEWRKFLLIPCSGPIYNLSLRLNLPGFYLYL